MKTKHHILTYISILVAYLVLDGIWLGIVAKDAYLESMQGMLREEYPLAPWITFYVMYSFAILWLVVLPNIKNTTSAKQTLFSGAVLGMASYGTYNLTNFAIIEGWQLSITVKDWLWGITVTTLSSFFGWAIAQKVKSS